MKQYFFYFFIITSLIPCCKSVYLNSNQEFSFKRTKKIQKFLYNEYGKDLNISDSIINIGISNFSMEIAKDKPPKYINKLSDSLIKLDEKNNYSDYKISLNKILKTKIRKDSQYKVFFSRPESNYIIVEVFKTKNKDYFELTTFNESHLILFIFSSKNKIIEKYKLDMIYD